MRKASFGRILWGLGLLAAAAFLVLDQLHLIPVELGFWTIFWTVVFAATLITSLINRSLGGTIFSIAFLLIIYAKPLHIESIVPWTVLLAAFLVWGGLRLIFKKSWKPTVIINGEKVSTNWSDLKAPHKFKAEHVFSDTTSSDNGDNIVISEKSQKNKVVLTTLFLFLISFCIYANLLNVSQLLYILYNLSFLAYYS